LRHIFDAALVRQQGLSDADRAAGVGHIDGLTAAIIGADFTAVCTRLVSRSDEQRVSKPSRFQFGAMKHISSTRA